MIDVQRIDDNTFEVTVEGRTVTEHEVTVPPAYHSELTGGDMSTEELVRRSFEFLLERESNTSILASFDLPVIQQYFPEYERTVHTWLEEPPD